MKNSPKARAPGSLGSHSRVRTASPSREATCAGVTWQREAPGPWRPGSAKTRTRRRRPRKAWRAQKGGTWPSESPMGAGLVEKAPEQSSRRERQLSRNRQTGAGRKGAGEEQHRDSRRPLHDLKVRGALMPPRGSVPCPCETQVCAPGGQRGPRGLHLQAPQGLAQSRAETTRQAKPPSQKHWPWEPSAHHLIRHRAGGGHGAGDPHAPSASTVSFMMISTRSTWCRFQRPSKALRFWSRKGRI